MRVVSPQLALLALAAHALAIGLLEPGSSDLLRRALIVGGYLLALACVWQNRRLRFMQVLGIGLLLNLLPVLANGGLMPITPENAARAGIDLSAAGVRLGEPIPHSKDILLEASDTRLGALSDSLVLPSALPGRGVASPGDVVIVISILLAVAAVARSAVTRLSQLITQHPAQAASVARRL